MDTPHHLSKGVKEWKWGPWTEEVKSPQLPLVLEVWGPVI